MIQNSLLELNASCLDCLYYNKEFMFNNHANNKQGICIKKGICLEKPLSFCTEWEEI